MKIESGEVRKTVSFTGYRPQKLSFGSDESRPEAVKLRAVMKNEVAALCDEGYRYFQSGMALGIDLMCAEIVEELRDEKYGEIALFPIIPCRNHCARWDEADRERFQRILKRGDGSIMVSDREYFNGCMMARNRFLVDTAHLLLAVFDGKSGGTMNTVEYAKKQGKKLVVIDPVKLVRITLFDENNQQTLFD